MRRGFATSCGTFSNVDFPGATRTQAYGVNDTGDIVGDYFDAANVEQGFVSTGGTFTAIDFPGAASTVCAGINAAGDIVGGFSDTTGGFHGFLLQGGVFAPSIFPSPPARPPSASATPGRSPATTATPQERRPRHRTVTHQERGLLTGAYFDARGAARAHRPVSDFDRARLRCGPAPAFGATPHPLGHLRQTNHQQ
jgi:hypothetical protein